ncbi:MAG: hypothetical protein K2X69_14135 [Silvanigrellaceae bacterium]|nr:hypothetical protein [Silvanigrellaceae bacterium]
MKKIFLPLITFSTFIISCSNNNEAQKKGSYPNEYNYPPQQPQTQQKPPINYDDSQAIEKPPKEPKPIEEKISTLYFGSRGFLTLNNETGEYTIDKMPKENPDINIIKPIIGLFDSIVDDPEYIYKSSLFPIDRYSLFQIPEILEFDKINSVDGQPSKDKNDVWIHFGGRLGKLGKSYFACYKSFDNKYSKLDFIIDGANQELLNCPKAKKLIDENKITPLNIKGGDFMPLRFASFRGYSYGDCFDYRTCVISYNINIKYYIQMK